MQEPIKKEKKIHLSRNDLLIISDFFQSVDEDRAVIIPMNSGIKIQGKSGHSYELKKKNNNWLETNTNEKNITHIYSQQNIESKDAITLKRRPKSRRKKVKTRKGRIRTKKIAQILAPAIVIVGVLGTSFLFSKRNTEASNKAAIETVVETNDLNDFQQIKITIDLSEKDTKDQIDQEQIEQSLDTYTSEIENKSEIKYITQTIKNDISSSQWLEKREETETLFGQEITSICDRFGLSKAVVSSLLTQERESNSEKKYINIGQLTRSICNEPMVLPIIKYSKEDLVQHQEVDKIYVVRDEPNRATFQNEADYKIELEKYKNQLQRSKELKNQGYRIFYFQDLMKPENYRDNIYVSLAYLTHCIYQCDLDINKGICAYNSGYGTAMKYNNDEIMNGSVKVGDAFYNQHVYSYILPEEYNDLTWYFKEVPDFKLTEEERQNLTKEEQQRKKIEAIHNAPIITIQQDFPKMKEKYYEKENGHSL